MNPNATVPVIELNRTILTQSYAILRHFARQLEKYDGQTEDEKYWADAMCDIAFTVRFSVLDVRLYLLTYTRAHSLRPRVLQPQ